MTAVAPPSRLLVLGEVLVDLLPASAGAQTAQGRAGASMALTARFGGSPANVAVGLARLEIPVSFAGRLSRRGYGPWLRAHLDAEGVGLATAVDAPEPCTLAVVSLDEAGVASYEFYGPDTADWAWQATELPDPASLAGACVHTGSLATGIQPGAGVLADWLGRLRRQGDVAISYDPNIRPTILGDGDLDRTVVAPVLGSAHLVKVSEEDLSVLCPGRPVEEAVAGWLAGAEPGPGAGPELVVVTGGERGATAWHRDGRRLSRPVPPIEVVDTVGAGDAFTAGLLASLDGQGVLSPAGLAKLATDELVRAIDYANRVAAVTCTRPGADPPRRAELEANAD